MVRYSNQSFFSQMDVFPPLSSMRNQEIAGNQTQFTEVLGDTMNHLAVQAATGDQSGEKFATIVVNLTSSQTLYTLAQCTPDLTANDCERCLRFRIAQLPTSSGARVLLPSCCVHYESYPFFDRTTNSSTVPAIPLGTTNP